MKSMKYGWSRILALAGLLAGVGALGAGAMYLYLGGSGVESSRPMPAPSPSASAPSEPEISLAPEAAARAGIRTAKPTLGRISGAIVAPGIVEPNAYGQVVVRSVAGGQVRSVAVGLGAQVRRGDLLATVHSPDLAETLRVYLSMQSEFEAAHQRLTRLEGLVKIGAASQQELEVARAEHTRHATDVESARAKLTLLGITPNQLSSLNESAAMDSTVRVTSPSNGVITARTINAGANIDPSTDLFTVVDLKTVWILASVYERDLGRIQTGTEATITSPSVPGRTWAGRVNYIDPQLNTETRTATVRIEVENPGGPLRLGTYADVVLRPSKSAEGLMVPKTSIQNIGAQAVVYVADPKQPGRYFERAVILGAAAGQDIEIYAGVEETDEVVVAGSFALRAERDRLGLPAPVALAAPAKKPGAATGKPGAATQVRRVEVAVRKEGFTPSSVTVDAGQPFDLVFIRQTEETCATEVVVPSLNVRRALPLNQRVTIRVPASKAGTLAFSCGMNMLHGTVVVR